MKPWDTYLDSLTAKQQEAVLSVLEQAEEYIPDCERAMSYAMPTLKCRGTPVLSVAAWKDHIGLYPHGTEAISQALSHLVKAQADTDKGTIRFGYDNLPNKDVIEAVVIAKLQSMK